MAVSTDLEQIAAALEARSEEIIDAGVAAIRAKIPVYAAMDERGVADVRAHVATHQRQIVCAMRRPPEREDFEFVAVHAARRARNGIPLPDFLQAFRTYHAVVWSALMEIVEEHGLSGRATLEAARPVMDYIDLAATRAGEAYVDAQQLLLAEGDRVRRDLLDNLLAGRPPGSAARVAAARAAGIEAGKRLVLVVALPVDRDEDEFAIRARAAALAAPLTAALAPLTVVRGGEIVIVGAPGEGGLRQRLEPASEGLAVGVGTLQDSLEGLPDAYEEASLALRHVPAAGGVVSLPDMSAFDYLTLRDDDTARRMVDPVVERFVREDLEKGGALCDTLLAYAAADLNAKEAAEKLFVHFNTAHYRLGKIEERTGRDMRRLADVVDLVIAIRLARR
jgi:hypothetical protein